jgi:hypothetical protein
LRSNIPVTYWWDNVCIVNLAWEQILSNTNKRANAPLDDYTRTQIEYLSWGSAFREFLSGCGVPAAKITVTGNPNYALLAERYDFLVRDRTTLADTYGLDPYKGWVFIPENYGWAFLSDAQIEIRVRAGAYTAEHALAYRQFQQRTLQALVHWLGAAACVPEIQFILRPRPATPPQRLRDCFVGGVPANVAILKDGTAREWLLASDLVVSNYSTVLVDAAVAGKPVGLIQAEAFPDFLHADFLDHIPALGSVDAFLEVCRRPASIRTLNGSLRDYALKNFHAPGDPFIRTADWLAALRNHCRKAPRYLYGRGWYRCDRSWRRWLPFGLRLAVSRARHGTPLPTFQDDAGRPFIAQTHSGDRLAPDALAELESKIKHHLRAQRSPTGGAAEHSVSA